MDVDNMPPWAIATQDNKLFNSSSFRTANANSCALAGRLPKLQTLVLQYPVKSSAFIKFSRGLIISRYIVTVFCLFMIIFVIILAKKRDIKLKYRQKFRFFSYFVKSFRS